MMRKLILAAAAVALVHAGAPALAAEKATPQVDIEANQMEILDADKKAIFRGGVIATRAGVNLKCDELTVRYDDVKQPDLMVSTGGWARLHSEIWKFV